MACRGSVERVRRRSGNSWAQRFDLLSQIIVLCQVSFSASHVRRVVSKHLNDCVLMLLGLNGVSQSKPVVLSGVDHSNLLVSRHMAKHLAELNVCIVHGLTSANKRDDSHSSCMLIMLNLQEKSFAIYSQTHLPT